MKGQGTRQAVVSASDKTVPRTTELTRTKRIVFTLILMSLPVLLLVGLELTLRQFEYGGNLDLVVRKRVGGREWYAINRGVAKRYFAQAGTVVPEPPEDLFATEKTARTKRIFCLGESTMAGFPYEFNATAPSFLRDRLKTLLPQYDIEVINLGLSAVGSYVVNDFVRELVLYRPDLIIIYVGHNEFYGVYGPGSVVAVKGGPWLTRLNIYLLRFKTFLMLRDGYSWLMRKFSHPAPAQDVTLMQEMVGNQQIPYGSEAYLRGKEIYLENLRRIVDEARAHGVPVMFSTLVSNVRSQVPLQSVFSPATTEISKKQWEELVTAGDRFSSSGSVDQAADAYLQATLLDSSNAMAFFKLGTEQYRLGRFDEAQRAFLRAKDLDALRFRASEEFQALLINFCRSHDVPVSRVDSAFAAASPDGLVGNELILEHLHPNIDGYFLIAKTWCSTISQGHLLAHPDEWQWAGDKSDSAYMVLSTVADFDRLQGKIKVSVLTHRWPFISHYDGYTFTPANEVEKIVYQYTQGKTAWSDARYQLSEYYARTGKYENARNECMAVSKVIPFSFQPLLRIADYYSMEGRNSEARQAYQRCIQVEDNPYARMKLGILLLQEEHAADAVTEIETAFKLDTRAGNKFPRNASATGRYLLGVAYVKLGNYPQARENLQRAIAIDPTYNEPRKLLEQLPK